MRRTCDDMAEPPGDCSGIATRFCEGEIRERETQTLVAIGRAYPRGTCIERLWRSVKYEEVYLKAYESMADARSGIGEYLNFYNSERKHQTLGKTPDLMYFGETMWQEAA